jgi:hypothetical protein
MNYNTIRLEKGMYGVRGKSFTQVLEELDPSENYKNSPLGGLDAYQRQLKRFGIKVSGPSSDTVSKFFGTTDSASLFPEFVSRAARAGIEDGSFLSEIIASTTQVDLVDYRSLAPTPDGTDAAIKEGGEIPSTLITTKNNLVKMSKRGRILAASYEALKNQRLDLFTVIIKQIGASIVRAQMQDAIDVLINGDGNSNAADVISAASSGTLTYEDLLALWAEFNQFSLNTLIASPDAVLLMATLPEFQNPLVGIKLDENSRKFPTPLGADLIKSAGVPVGNIIGLDKNCALEKVECGGITVDYDKLVDRQLESATITSTVGFAKIFDGASKVLSI